MRFVSPTGSPIVGTLEVVQARADAAEFSETGEPDYDGYTEVFWDTQETVRREGSRVYMDEDGEEWLFKDLILEDQFEEGDESEDDDPPASCENCGNTDNDGSDICPDCGGAMLDPD